jgi:hypothetical protein
VQVRITVHVDDLFVTCCKQVRIMELATSLRESYEEINCVQGPVSNYLGMTFDTSTEGEARVTMKGFVDDPLKWYGGTGTANSPAGKTPFSEKLGAAVCEEEARKRFHSTVAKLLYLTKRARPDVLTAVSYLATRVQKCDEEDVRKLERVMSYLRGSSERGVVFRPGKGEMTVRVFVDAAYGVHSIGKSHTGACVVVGDVGAVHCKFEKQKIVTKSSTEAELVALSDSCNQGLHVRRLLQEQRCETGAVTVYRYNMSCLAMVARGGSAAEKTRHIDIRYFWVKERVDEGEVKIEHLGTERMYANVLTKSLQEGQYYREVKMMTGW